MHERISLKYPLQPFTLNVSDDEVVDIEAFVIRVGFCVLEERQKELCRLLGPTSLASGSVPGLGLGVASGTADVAPGEKGRER